MEVSTPVVLVVDDDERNRKLMQLLIGSEHLAVIMAGDGVTALSMAINSQPSVIVLDLMMPGWDGFEVLKRLKSEPVCRQIPVIVLTALDDLAALQRAIALGATLTLTKPIDRWALMAAIENALCISAYLQHLHRTSVAMINSEWEKWFEQDRLQLAALGSWQGGLKANALRRIACYSRELGIAYGMDDGDISDLFHAAPSHDLGLFGLDVDVYQRTEPLGQAEWAAVRTHPDRGARLLRNVATPLAELALDIALYHHERWDGSGYPGGIAGEQIPLAARIVAVCDVYDAIRSNSVFRQGRDHDTAVRALLEGDDRSQPDQFDPDILNAFEQCRGLFKEICDAHA